MTDITLSVDQMDVLNEYAENYGECEVTDYSGRFMYGSRCIGFIAFSPVQSVAGLIFHLMQDGHEDIAEILASNSIRQDSMGRDYVYYFPYVGLPDGYKFSDGEDVDE